MSIITTSERQYLISNMTELLTKYNYTPTESAINKIIDTWAQQKHDLIEAFKNHPNYLEGKFMIAFDKDYDRAICTDTARQFYNWLNNTATSPMSNCTETLPSEVDELRRNEGQRYLPDKMMSTIFAIIQTYERTISAEEAIRINDAFPAVHAHEGHKRTRVINKIMTYLNYNTCPDYNRKFAEYADSLSPMSIRRHTILSLNPLDYFTMSFGNSWSSCHTIDKENTRHMENDYEGRYSSGTMSYMLDGSSMIFYTVDASYDGTDYWNEPKINRQMFHWGNDKLVQGRLYPQSNDNGANDLYTSYRTIVQEIVATVFNFPNLWDLRRGSDEDQDYTYSKGTHYRDYEHFDNCTISTMRDSINDDLVQIGAWPICVHCGEEHDISDNIDCCKYHEGMHKCADCGEWVNDEYLTEIDGELYCNNCYFTCPHCGSLHPNRNGAHVRHYGWVCTECLENSDNFVKCEECGDIYHINNICTLKKYNKRICCNCLTDHYTRCHICGQYELDRHIKHLPGGAYACPECHSIFKAHINDTRVSDNEPSVQNDDDDNDDHNDDDWDWATF